MQLLSNLIPFSEYSSLFPSFVFLVNLHLYLHSKVTPLHLSYILIILISVMIHWHICTISDLNNISPVLKFVFLIFPFLYLLNMLISNPLHLIIFVLFTTLPYSSLLILNSLPFLPSIFRVGSWSSDPILLNIKNLAYKLNIHTSIEASYYLYSIPLKDYLFTSRL